jgi:hypothetical protein
VKKRGGQARRMPSLTEALGSHGFSKAEADVAGVAGM